MLQTFLFFHMLAVVMLFSGMALEVAGFARLHRATTIAEVRAATLNFPLVGPLMGVGSLLVIAMGAMVYVAGLGWGPAWISVVFILTIVLAVNGPVTNGKRCQASYMMAMKGGEGPIARKFRPRGATDS